MRPPIRVGLAIVGLLLSAAACGRADEPPPAPPPPSPAPAGLREIAGSTASPADGAEPTDSRSAMALDTEALATGRVADATPTAADIATAGPSPTPWPTVTPGPLPAGLPETDPSTWPSGDLSPDGRWWVRSVVGEEIPVGDGRVLSGADSGSAQEAWYHRGQQVVATDGSIAHMVLDRWAPAGMGAPAPAVLGWAPDGSWVYLYETGTADGCGLYPWGRDLRRLAPESGELQYLQDWMPSAPALSPDGRTVAFAAPPRIVLLRPDDGSFLELAIPGQEWGEPRAGDLRFDAEGRLELTVDYQACSAQWTRARVRVEPLNGRAELLGTPAPAPLP